MKSLPISMQTGLEESERAFVRLLDLLHLDRQQLEQKVRSIRSTSMPPIKRINTPWTYKETRHV